MKICSIFKKIVGKSHSEKSNYQRLVVAGNAETVEVRKGYVAVYVGEEAKRYEIPVKYLSFLPLRELLKQSQGDDLDNDIDGPIHLPCTPDTFDKSLKLIAKTNKKHLSTSKNKSLHDKLPAKLGCFGI